MSQGEPAAARATSSSAVVPIVDCTCAPPSTACQPQGLCRSARQTCVKSNQCMLSGDCTDPGYCCVGESATEYLWCSCHNQARTGQNASQSVWPQETHVSNPSVRCGSRDS